MYGKLMIIKSLIHARYKMKIIFLKDVKFGDINNKL